MVFDWAIGNKTCKDVENKSSYICGGNSTCIDSNNGSGYHCECNNDYHGNPYLHHDCQGIDLCIYIKFKKKILNFKLCFLIFLCLLIFLFFREKKT